MTENKNATTDIRLIERWLPIAALGEESIRERRSMTALPPTYYLHVWWARRPLVASRAAILASLLAGRCRPREVSACARYPWGSGGGQETEPLILRRRGESFGAESLRLSRAFGYVPDNPDDRNWLKNNLDDFLKNFTILDPTAGGGSIPFEAVRLGSATSANDLNPVPRL